MNGAWLHFDAGLAAWFWRPLLPAPPAVLLVAVALMVSLVVYVRSDATGRLWVLALRVLLIVAFGALLLNPCRPDPAAQSDLHRATQHLLVDSSLSMKRSDVRGRSRWDIALDTLRQSGWAKRSSLRIHRFDEASASIDWPTLMQTEPAGRQTRLTDALLRLLGRADVRAGDSVVLLSDGRDTGPLDPRAALDRIVDAAAAKGVTVFTIALGATDEPADVVLHAYAEPDRVFNDQPVRIHVALRQSGYADLSTQVTLNLDGRPIAAQNVRLPAADRAATLTFTHKPKLGDHDDNPMLHYTVSVDAMAREATIANNQRELFVRPIGRRLRVVCFEGRPYWETRFLLRALRSDPRIDLTAVQALRNDRIQTTHDGGDSIEAPLTQAALSQYDVVILGKGAERFFGAQRAQLLTDYVSAGRGLMAARGQPFNQDTPQGQTAAEIFRAIEPAQWGERVVRELSIQLTDPGRRLIGNVRTRQLPDMIAATQNLGTKSAAVVLLTQQPQDADAPAMAAAAYQRIGSGRVLQVMTDGLWRWAMQPPDRNDAGSAYRSFMINAVRWLATGGELIGKAGLALSLDRHATSLGETVNAEVRSINQSAQRLIEAGCRLHHIRPDGSTQTLNPGARAGDPNRLRTGFVPERVGVHTVELRDADGRLVQSTKLACYDPADEQRQSGARPDWLAQLARRTGGRAIPFDAPLPDPVSLTVPVNTTQQAQTTYRPIWTTGWVFVALILAMGVEWFARRSKGML